ncbi:histone-like nucleoid-structuring protein Lsr2 [Streptomyces sp. SAJ15]|uniref:Lsr2 family DNA-binding protein n=1 Tax=Streptomyces sp. SAJ15 TaxID=2011095 RepID=UPI001184ADEB|nr:histone-like nucleoid-structuring protein Lsr2 [Streptomyces sp. SAJ15]TVL88460.1 hypothetical protein CD790_30920 [Streptomyces sp. SAJ15]
MFIDWKKALAAEGLALTSNSVDQLAAAARTVARRARDKQDLADLLGYLGLPRSEDDLVRMLPLLTAPTAHPVMGDDTMTNPISTTNAYTAVAASMLNKGDAPATVRQCLGLSDEELNEALTLIGQGAGSAAADIDDVAAATEALLVWGEKHASARIQGKASKARALLAELVSLRTNERAVAAKEKEITLLRDRLAQAEKELRQVRAGRITSTVSPVPAAQGALPTRSKEDRAAIRAWARANGHEVADTGLIPKKIQDAYDAAHPDQMEVAS